MNFMSRKSAGELTTARELSDRFDISLELMGKILQNLVRSGLVVSVQGVKGGYQLSRSGDEIKISSIITAIDGPIQLTDCSNENNSQRCKREQICTIKKPVKNIQSQIVDLLSGITLKDFQKTYS